MSASQLQFAKSETRDLAERDYRQFLSNRWGEPTDWTRSNSWFFIAFVGIAALLALAALVLR